MSGLQLAAENNFSLTSLEMKLTFAFCQYCVHSLTRRLFSNLWLPLWFTSALCLGSESCWTHDHTFLYSLISAALPTEFMATDSEVCGSTLDAIRFSLPQTQLLFAILLWHRLHRKHLSSVVILLNVTRIKLHSNIVVSGRCLGLALSC